MYKNIMEKFLPFLESIGDVILFSSLDFSCMHSSVVLTTNSYTKTSLLNLTLSQVNSLGFAFFFKY